MRRAPAGLALAATAALLLAGCSGDASASGDDEKGPLTAFFEKYGESMTEEDSDRQQRQYEDVVAACMAEQGFEYVPQEPTSYSVNTDDLPDWESREFAEQYGYGATTSDELYGGDDEEEWVDPNADYVAAMSDGERAAYELALYGESIEEDVDLEGEADPDAEMAIEYDWESNGCNGRAYHEVYETDDLFSDPELEPVMDELNRAWEKLADEPDVRKATEKWSTCMADAGHDFATPDEASTSIHDKVNELWESAFAGMEEAEADAQTQVEPDPAKMAELKKEEIALATADYECKESSGYQAAYKAANAAMEKRLWEQYGAQLEAAFAKKSPAK